MNITSATEGPHAAPAGPPQSPDPAFLQKIAQSQQALLAQCPAVPTPSPEEAARLPINVDLWGNVGPRVLLIHGGVQGGLGGGPVTWDGQRMLADQGWRIERVDRPGFGGSPSRGPDDMQRDAEWIADMVGEGAVLVGHSWGGAEALLGAAKRADKVHALILVEPALHALIPTQPEAANPAVREALATMASVFEAETPAEYGRRFGRAMGTVSADSENAAAPAPARDDAAAALGCALLRGRMAQPETLMMALEAVADAGIPTLTITGGWNPVFDAIANMVARITRGEPVTVPSANHFVQQTSAAAFNEIVAAFLGRRLPSGFATVCR